MVADTPVDVQFLSSVFNDSVRPGALYVRLHKSNLLISTQAGVARSRPNWSMSHTLSSTDGQRTRFLETMLYRPTLDNQLCDSKLRGIYVESYPISSGKAAPESPQDTGIHGQLYVSGLFDHKRDEFEVEIHPPHPLTVMPAGSDI